MQEKTKEHLSNFAWRFRDLLERRHLSQADVARSLGIHPAKVGNWYQGRNLPKKKDWPIIARLLHVGTDELFRGAPSTGIYPNQEISTPLVHEEPAPGFPRNNPPISGKGRDSSVQINPAFAPPAPNPTSQDCFNHLAAYLAEAEHVPGGVAEAFRILTKRLDLDEIRKDRAKLQA